MKTSKISSSAFLVLTAFSAHAELNESNVRIIRDVVVDIMGENVATSQSAAHGLSTKLLLAKSQATSEKVFADNNIDPSQIESIGADNCTLDKVTDNAYSGDRTHSFQRWNVYSFKCDVAIILAK